MFVFGGMVCFLCCCFFGMADFLWLDISLPAFSAAVGRLGLLLVVLSSVDSFVSV